MTEHPIEREDVQVIMRGVWNANRKLDDILQYLHEDDGEEEAEPDA